MALRLSTGLRNKLLGINLEMVLNGGFATVTTYWTAVTAALTVAGSGQGGGNCLQIAESGGAAAGQAYQDIATIIGRLYRLTLYFKKGTGSSGAFFVGTTGSYNAIYSSGSLTDAAWAKYTIFFIATATTTRITLQETEVTGGTTAFFDTVSMVDYARCIQDIFNLGFINIYTGTQPATANLAVIGTLLLTISNNAGATGLTLADASAGAINKTVSETWSGACGVAGTGGWGRFYAAGDDLGDSTIEERIDGAVATSGAEFNFSSGVSWAQSSVQVLTSFQLTLPTL